MLRNCFTRSSGETYYHRVVFIVVANVDTLLLLTYNLLWTYQLYSNKAGASATLHESEASLCFVHCHVVVHGDVLFVKTS